MLDQLGRGFPGVHFVGADNPLGKYFQQPHGLAHVRHAHNDYLQFLIEYGVLGSLQLLLFVLCALYHAQKAMWQRESVYRNGVGFGASVGIVALLMHSFANFNRQIPANAATYVVLCAIAVIGNNHYRERRARTRD